MIVFDFSMLFESFRLFFPSLIFSKYVAESILQGDSIGFLGMILRALDGIEVQELSKSILDFTGLVESIKESSN